MLVLAAALAVAAPASAQVPQRLESTARGFGHSGLLQDVPLLPEGVPVTPPPQNTPSPDLELEEGQVNFEYAEMVDRFESLRRTVVRGKKRRRRRVEVPTGVTDADRVEDGGIKKIVLHASGGAGACDGSVSHLLNAKTAAHFIVCRDGRVTRMVRIEDIANHVKNDAVDRESVGIETESGHPNSPYFRDSDWSPEAYWKMYASMAWLIRAIAKEAGVPRDRSAVITHEEADRGIRGAHTDPGPPFDGGSQPAFDARFPGQNVSPREFLMRLVTDDAPPRLWRRTGPAGDGVEVKDAEQLGLAHIRVWRLDAAGKPATKVSEWSAPANGLPPVSRLVAAPAEPGAYRIVARDLVGNTSAALLRVADPLQPAPDPTLPTADLKVFLFQPRPSN
ncbi:N-acetylmuramoyl-L-alanine amidase [bacterium]|nr:MAG: N-acetylmuramoyl-L-alanine amidase [bacterium]